MDCREFKAIVDSYISDELLVETNHEVLQHLEKCANCRNEMSRRRDLRLQLTNAVRMNSDSMIDPAFQSRTVATLRERALHPGFLERYLDGSLATRYAVGIAAAVTIAVTGIFFLAPTTNILTNSNIDLANAVRASWTELAAHAAGDHENCAVNYRLKEAPITLDEAATKFGAYNKDLDKVVMKAFGSEQGGPVSQETKFLESHSCVYQGRRYAHVVVTHRGKMVSFLVTDTDLPAGAKDIQTDIIDTAVNAAGFLAGHQAVFVVSQLTEGENESLARVVAPAIRGHVEKMTL